jgi:beta-galactosidase
MIVLTSDAAGEQAFELTWKAAVGGREIASGTQAGRLAARGVFRLPIDLKMPLAVAGAKIDGQVRLSATIGGTPLAAGLDFRLFGPDAPNLGPVHVLDPAGVTSAMLKELGYMVIPLKEGEKVRLVAIGAGALAREGQMLAKLEGFVKAGGRVMVFRQDGRWIREHMAFRVGGGPADVARQVFRVEKDHPAVAGLDAADLREWAHAAGGADAGAAALADGAKKQAGARAAEEGAVAEGVIEKPVLAGWRAFLDCGLRRDFTPLMELDYGRGKVVWCQLDLEDCYRADPAAERLAHQTVRYVRTCEVPATAPHVVYLGAAAEEALLRRIGLIHTTEIHPEQWRAEDLFVVGPCGSDAAAFDAAMAKAELIVRGGGMAYFLPGAAAEAKNVSTEMVENFRGSCDVPAWPECRGLGEMDLLWPLAAKVRLVTGRCEIAAGGLMGRKQVGRGVNLYCMLDPAAFAADASADGRIARRRCVRAMVQILANMGAAFEADAEVFRAVGGGAGTTAPATRANVSMYMDE